MLFSFALDVRAVDNFDNLVGLFNALQHIFDCDAFTIAVHPLLVVVEHPYFVGGLSQVYDSAGIKQALVSDPMAC
jgi:hypothetical protein